VRVFGVWTNLPSAGADLDGGCERRVRMDGGVRPLGTARVNGLVILVG
jgi:hypothetical protein